MPALRAGDGSRPERGGQYIEIGAAISGITSQDAPDFSRGSSHAAIVTEEEAFLLRFSPRLHRIVAHVHERIANRRLNFAHQTSRKVVDRFGTIVFEDLNITNMQKNHHLAKSIADVAWNMFITITESKAEDAGSRVILVNPRNTSQICSRCGMIVAKTLSDRVHSCSHCGLVMDRDQNAAINIMRLGLQSQG